jgi:hypothetical protein
MTSLEQALDHRLAHAAQADPSDAVCHLLSFLPGPAGGFNSSAAQCAASGCPRQGRGRKSVFRLMKHPATPSFPRRRESRPPLSRHSRARGNPDPHPTVIPAHAGIHAGVKWIPAFAGMTAGWAWILRSRTNDAGCKAGVFERGARRRKSSAGVRWIPAFAGMTAGWVWILRSRTNDAGCKAGGGAAGAPLRRRSPQGIEGRSAPADKRRSDFGHGAFSAHGRNRPVASPRFRGAQGTPKRSAGAPQ